MKTKTKENVFLYFKFLLNLHLNFLCILGTKKQIVSIFKVHKSKLLDLFKKVYLSEFNHLSNLLLCVLIVWLNRHT